MKVVWQPATKQPAFALVVVLLLTTLMLVSAQSLAVFAGAEGVVAARTGNDLQHRLAAESILLALPELRANVALKNGAHPELESFEFECGDCRAHVEILPHRLAMAIGPQSEIEPSRLIELARTANLSAENVSPRPIESKELEFIKSKFLWFDQLAHATRFEEIFRLRTTVAASDLKPRCWSDLVTFWGNSAATITHVRITTRMGNDTRQWFAACAINQNQVVVHYLGML